MKDQLVKLPYWESLTEDEKALVERNARIVHYDKGNVLHGNCDGGGSCLGMIQVISGELRTYVLSEEGREITLFKLNAGDSCVMALSCVISQISFETQMIASEDTELLLIPVGTFVKLFEKNLNVKCYMYETTTARLSAAMWVMQQIIFFRFDQRLASYFLDEYEQTGSTRIRMTQEQIATNVNSSREVVSRMLKQFAGDGLITNRRGVIELIDLDGLRQLKY